MPRAPRASDPADENEQQDDPQDSQRPKRPRTGQDDGEPLEPPEEYDRAVVYGVVRTAEANSGREVLTEVYLGTLGRQGYDLDKIGAKWGGGRFRAYFKLAGERAGRRTFTLPGRRTWDASAVPGLLQEEMQAAAPMLATTTPAVAPAAPETVPAAGYPPGDRLSRIEAALERLLTAQSQPRSTTAEVLDVLKVARDVFKPAEPLSADVLTTFFRQGLQAARSEKGGADNGIAGAIRDTVPGVLKVVEKAIDARASAVPVLAGKPAPRLAVVNEQEKGQQMPPWATKLVEELKRAIAAKDDPAWTADWIERYVPPAIVDQLRGPEVEVLQGFSAWVNLVPELATEEGGEFMRSVLGVLRSASSEPEPEEQEA